MRVVSYTRATTVRVGEENPKNTIGIQNEHIRQYIKGRGWVLSEKYSDRKFSEEETAAFDRLTEDGLNRRFDCVVLDSVSRCGNVIGVAGEILLQTFYPAGIQFAIVEDDFFSAEKTAEEVEKYIRAKQFLCSIGQCRENINQMRADGLFTYHNQRYGYQISPDRKGMVMDEAVVQTVRNIYEWYLADMNFSSIAKRLNEAGVISPVVWMARTNGTETEQMADKCWHGSSVRTILKNPTYMGKAHCRMNGTEIILEVPPMVSEEIFQKAQEKLAKCKIREERWKTNTASILYRKIYDKETGQPLMCIKANFGGREQVYTREKRNRYLSKKDRALCIPRDTVLAEVRKALIREKALARAADRLLQTEEAEKYLDQALSPYRDKAKGLLSRINAAYERRMEAETAHEAGQMAQAGYKAQEEQLEEEFLRCEQEFQGIMAAVGEWRDAFSGVNPWIKLYRDIKIPEKLERKHIHKWIGRVLVEDFQTVTVRMQEQEWKDRLPQEWLRAELEV